jgi:formate/nitrite transporter FocA (FNT family)
MLAHSIRFACGAVFGIAVAFWLVVTTNSVPVFAGGIIGGGLLGGYLSARFGLRFWEWVRHLKWFVP